MAEYTIFNSGVLGALKTKGYVSSQENDLSCDQALISVSEWADKRGIDLSTDWVAGRFNGAQVAALTDYMDWLETWKGMPQIITLSTISMTLEIPLSSGAKITLAASAIVNDADHLGRAYIELHDHLTRGYETFRQKRQLQSAAPSNGNGSSGDSPTTEIVDVQDIVTETRNGKTYHRLAGGNWVKFGVAAWPEIFERAGIDTSNYQSGRQPFAAGYKMELELENGKPKRVKRLIVKG